MQSKKEKKNHIPIRLLQKDEQLKENHLKNKEEDVIKKKIPFDPINAKDTPIGGDS